VLGVVTAGIGFVCLLPLFCLLIPIGWILSIIIEQAQAAVVLEDLGMLDGFKRGWQIVKTNAVPTIVMSLILGVGGAIISVIVSLPIILAFIPVFMSMSTLRESLTPLYISLVCCAVYMPVLIFFNGILTAYIQSAWALTFMQLAGPKEDAPVFVEANA
jgi:Zn-dependent protease with chaperone function